MKARQLVVGLVIALLFSVSTNAQDAATPQSGSLDAALKYLDAADRDAGYTHYVDTLTPIIVRSFRNKRPDLSEACWAALDDILRSEMLAHSQDIKLISARAYARQFTDEELAELSAFQTSALGKRYRDAVAEVISQGVKHPKNAQRFVEVFQKIVADQDPVDAVKRFPVLLTALKAYLSEREIGQLADFFYNGVGKKSLEITPLINAETLRNEAELLAKDMPAVKQAWMEKGNCK